MIYLDNNTTVERPINDINELFRTSWTLVFETKMGHHHRRHLLNPVSKLKHLSLETENIPNWTKNTQAANMSILSTHVISSNNDLQNIRVNRIPMSGFRVESTKDES